LTKLRGVDRVDLLMLGLFFVPLISVIVFRSSLYDAWRQMFFVYPAVLYLGVYAVSLLPKKMSMILIMLVGLNITFAIYSMFKLHPFENMYFNYVAKQILALLKKTFRLIIGGFNIKRVWNTLLKPIAEKA